MLQRARLTLNTFYNVNEYSINTFRSFYTVNARERHNALHTDIIVFIDSDMELLITALRVYELCVMLHSYICKGQCHFVALCMQL